MEHPFDHQVDRIKQLFHLDTDTELAAHMQVTRSAVAKWRARGVPDAFIHLCAPGGASHVVFSLMKDARRKLWCARDLITDQGWDRRPIQDALNELNSAIRVESLRDDDGNVQDPDGLLDEGDV